MKSESDDVELQQKSSKLSPSQPGPLVHFPFHSAINSQCLLHWTKRPGCQIKCWLQNWKYSILLASLEKNVSTPLTPPTPPGAPPARVVHLPSSSPCHQEAKGRGYLHSHSLVVADLKFFTIGDIIHQTFVLAQWWMYQVDSWVHNTECISIAFVHLNECTIFFSVSNWVQHAKILPFPPSCRTCESFCDVWEFQAIPKSYHVLLGLDLCGGSLLACFSPTPHKSILQDQPPGHQNVRLGFWMYHWLAAKL